MQEKHGWCGFQIKRALAYLYSLRQARLRVFSKAIQKCLHEKQQLQGALKASPDFNLLHSYCRYSSKHI